MDVRFLSFIEPPGYWEPPLKRAASEEPARSRKRIPRCLTDAADGIRIRPHQLRPRPWLAGVFLKPSLCKFSQSVLITIIL